MRAPSRIIMSGYCLGEDGDGLQNAEAGFAVVNTRANSLRGPLGSFILTVKGSSCFHKTWLCQFQKIIQNIVANVD